MSLPHDDAHPAVLTRRQRLREVAFLFTRLGFTAFGGPVAHIAIIEDEVVQRRRWLDRQHFLDIVAALNFIPGPNSTELAIYLGRLRAGWPGLVTGGVCFIAPAVLIILPIAWAYVTYGTLPALQPVLRAVGAAIVAIVAVATVRFARVALRDGFTIAVAIAIALAAGAIERFYTIQPEIPALAVAALAGAAWYARRQAPTLCLGALPLAAIVVADERWARMALFFLKVGATLFGSGYVLVSYLQSGLVDDYGWLDQRQLLDAIAVGQFTPGPLLTTATFVGFLLGHTRFEGGLGGGVAGALLATAAIFLPSFVFVALLGPLLGWLRKSPVARGALNAMNAAVVALMLVATLRLAAGALFHGSLRVPDWLGCGVLVAAALALARGVNATWIVLGAALIGWIGSVVS